MNPLRRALLLTAALVGVYGCLSPTLPLPPPEEPDTMSEPAPGEWLIRGSCDVGAQVTVVNQITGRGAVYVDRESRGRYVVEIEGAACDLVTVSQSRGDDTSAETRFILTPREAGIDTDPARCSP